MSSYSPKTPNETVNYTEGSFLAEFTKKIFLLLFFLAIIVFVISFSLKSFLSGISPEKEFTLASQFYTQENYENLPQSKLKVVALVKGLSSQYFENIDIRVKFSDDELPNAFMMIGGTMTFTEGFLKLAKSENEIAFVACHELGHFNERHIIKNMGNAVGPAIVIALLDNLSGGGIGPMFSSGFNLYQLNYSRDLESEADDFALSCLNKYYGHVGGATDFFEHIKDYKTKIDSFSFKENKVTDFLSTHPNTLERIEDINAEIKNKKLDIQNTVPYMY